MQELNKPIFVESHNTKDFSAVSSPSLLAVVFHVLGDQGRHQRVQLVWIAEILMSPCLSHIPTPKSLLPLQDGILNIHISKLSYFLLDVSDGGKDSRGEILKE